MGDPGYLEQVSRGRSGPPRPLGDLRWAGGSFKVYVLTLLMLCATRMKPLLSERVRTWDVLLY
jgi:hypothetical protein